MSDLSQFSDLEILALTSVGESESLGQKGMQQTINTVMNRLSAQLHWMGRNIREICLKPGQYDCWDAGKDRDRIIDIGKSNPLYGPYVTASLLARAALNGGLIDITCGAVSYVDGNAVACVHPHSKPCLIDGQRTFYDLIAVA